jgi:hypothetical protein
VSSVNSYAGIELSSANNSGLGIYATRSLKSNDILISVPTALTLSVEAPTDYNSVIEKNVFSSNPKAYRNAPWWASLSVQINYYDKINSLNEKAGVSVKSWMESLPRKYDTPIHWSEETLKEL